MFLPITLKKNIYPIFKLFGSLSDYSTEYVFITTPIEMLLTNRINNITIYRNLNMVFIKLLYRIITDIKGF